MTHFRSAWSLEGQEGPFNMGQGRLLAQGWLLAPVKCIMGTWEPFWILNWANAILRGLSKWRNGFKGKRTFFCGEGLGGGQREEAMCYFVCSIVEQCCYGLELIANLSRSESIFKALCERSCLPISNLKPQCHNCVEMLVLIGHFGQAWVRYISFCEAVLASFVLPARVKPCLWERPEFPLPVFRKTSGTLFLWELFGWRVDREAWGGWGSQMVNPFRNNTAGHFHFFLGSWKSLRVWWGMRSSGFCSETGTGVKRRWAGQRGCGKEGRCPQNRFAFYTMSVHLPNLSSFSRLDPNYMDSRNSGLAPDVFLCFPIQVFYHNVKPLFIKSLSLYFDNSMTLRNKIGHWLDWTRELFLLLISQQKSLMTWNNSDEDTATGSVQTAGGFR